MSEHTLRSKQTEAKRVPPASLMPLAIHQALFVDAILDPHKPVPPGLVGPDGRPSAKRFAVYRNNVVVGLMDALKAAFPVVLRLVGHDFFSAMARIYVAAEPPASPIMLDYGRGFPDFVSQFEPARSIPYLGDMARLERAWVQAYHAPDALPLSGNELAQVAHSHLPGLRLTLHPSIGIVRSAFPIVTLWDLNVEGRDASGFDLGDGGEDALVARPEAEVEVRTLPPGAASLIEALKIGAPILEALHYAMAEDPSFDLAATLAGLFKARVMVGFKIECRPQSQPREAG